MRLDDLCNQNLEKLENKARQAYIRVYADARKCCKICEERYAVDYALWNPISNLNDTWKIVEILDGYGFISMEYDKVTWDFTLEESEYKIVGEGIGFPQAVCNCLIRFAESGLFAEIEERNKNK